MSLNNTLFLVPQNVNRYFCPIFLCFDVTGCLLNTILFSQKRFQTISCCIYFLAASVTMLLTLLIRFGPHAYAEYNLILLNKTVLFCKIRGYTGQSVSMMYRWLMTMACIDRYMVSSDNVRLREFANPRIAYTMILKILLICTVLPAHNLIFLHVINNFCITRNAIFALYHSLFTFIFGGFIPIVVMILCTILIHYNLASKRARRQQHLSDQLNNQTFRLLSARDHQVLAMLFVQILFYILSTIPWMIFLFYSSFSYDRKNKTIDRIVIEIFFFYLTEILVYMYPVLSFYIYTLMSRTFRGELYHLICTLFQSRERSRYLPQPLLIPVKVDLEKPFKQPCTSTQLQSIEMETFSEFSSKFSS